MPPHDRPDPTSPTVTLPTDGGATRALPAVAADVYRIGDEVARGGIGRIVAAYDTRLEREVALKQLLDPHGEQRRFVREALLTARLQHPAIVPVHEVGRFPSGEPFIAMKRVRGQSLRQAIAARATVEERLQLLPNVLAVADAMAYAHSQRVIHRDLKPSNVLLGEFGETVVIDWGLAKQLDEAELAPPMQSEPPALPPAPEATRQGAVLGTPAYMAPEQAAGAVVDERSDVFALGAILYELISGEAPFEGDSATAVLEHARTGTPRPLAGSPGLPPDLVSIVGKAMAPEPAERYPDARALAADLHRFHLGQLVSSSRADVAARDPAADAAFADELRQRALRPLQITCVLMAVLVPLTGVVRVVTSGAAASPGASIVGEVVPRGIVVAIAAAIFAAARTALGRRHADLLAMLLIALVGALVCGLYLRGPETEFAGSTASMVLVLLGSSTMFHLPPRRMTALLTTISVSFLVTSIVFEAHPSPDRLLVQATLFSAATVVALLGVHVHFGILRDEFYNRRRLQDANRRLARIEPRR